MAQRVTDQCNVGATVQSMTGVRMSQPVRRTFAQLAHKGDAPLEQIQLSLGHASVQTTERYLGVKQDLTSAPCDVLGLK